MNALHLRSLLALALALAACGTAASPAQPVDAQASDTTTLADTAAGADASGELGPVADVAADTAADATQVADSADVSTETAAGDAFDAADAEPDALLDSATADADDGALGDVTPDSATDSVETDLAVAEVDTAPPDVCSGGLASCPKSAEGDPGTPAAWADASCLAPVSPDWQEAGLNATPDLNVEIGPLATAGAWAPYPDGAWAALYHGTQGMIHAEVAIRVTGAGLAAKQYTASVMRVAYIGCTTKTTAIPTSCGLAQQADGSYFSSSAGLLAVLDMDANSWKYCGQWVEIHVAVRLPDGRWGEGKTRVRLWDTKPTCPPP